MPSHGDQRSERCGPAARPAQRRGNSDEKQVEVVPPEVSVRYRTVTTGMRVARDHTPPSMKTHEPAGRADLAGGTRQYRPSHRFLAQRLAAPGLRRWIELATSDSDAVFDAGGHGPLWDLGECRFGRFDPIDARCGQARSPPSTMHRPCFFAEAGDGKPSLHARPSRFSPIPRRIRGPVVPAKAATRSR